MNTSTRTSPKTRSKRQTRSASKPGPNGKNGLATSAKKKNGTKAAKPAAKKASKSAAKKPVKRRATKKPAQVFTAKTADKHVLYQMAVQDAEVEVQFIADAFKDHRKRKALTLREDFCGTALICSHWVSSDKERTATGVDIDAKVLAWGKRNNIAPLGESAQRVELLRQDVRAKSRKKFDAVCAFNFSYWIFTTRDEMRDYFKKVRAGLAKDGIFAMDSYGGWEAVEPMYERRSIKRKFTYVWDQDEFDPVTHRVVNYIHFEFKDGTKLNKAFRYEWRYWSLPELKELLLEAGFSAVHVYWDQAEDEDDEDYKVTKRAENQPGWLAYLVALV